MKISIFSIAAFLLIHISQTSWAGDSPPVFLAACSAFCAFNTQPTKDNPKGGCSFVQMSSAGDSIPGAWQNLTVQCYNYAGGILVNNSPLPVSPCGQTQTLSAASPENSCCR